MDSNQENFIKSENHVTLVQKENGNTTTFTPLHLAARSKNAHDTMVIILSNVDTDAHNEEGDRPGQQVSVKPAAWSACRFLFRPDDTPDPNFVAFSGDTPLTGSCHCKSEEELCFELIFCGDDINKADRENKTVLHWAVIHECADVLAVLMMKFRPNIDVQDNKGNTPLHLAANNPGKEEIIKILLKSGANPNIQNERGFTPLHLTVEQKNMDGFVILLKHTAVNVNTAEHEFGCTPLITAVHMGLEEMLTLLIIVGADVQVKDKQGMTALHWAANFRKDFRHRDEFNALSEDLGIRRVNCVENLLIAGADVNALDRYDGNAPLHTAVETGALAVFQVLLKHPNIDLNVQRLRDKRTPLIIAVRLGLEEMFTHLITAGADLNVTDYNGKTALHSAAFTKYTGNPRPKMEANFVPDDFTARRAIAAKKLLSAGADANILDDIDGNTALHTAVEENTWSVFRVLLEYSNVDLNIHRRSDGKTPLMLLFEFDFSEGVAFQALIDAGADINAKDDEGKTWLHYAVKSNNIDDMLLLLEYDANVDVRDSKGQTPLFIAARRGQLEHCEALLELFYANRDIPDNRGRLPKDVAIENNFNDIVTILLNNMPAA